MTSNTSARTETQLSMMAVKLQNNPSYMAWVISAYQKQESIATYKLVELFNTNHEALARLALCKKPDTQSKSFREQLDQISKYTGIDTLILAKVIRQVESVEQLSTVKKDEVQSAPNIAKHGFAAARDKDETGIDEKKDSEEGNDHVVKE